MPQDFFAELRKRRPDSRLDHSVTTCAEFERIITRIVLNAYVETTDDGPVPEIASSGLPDRTIAPADDSASIVPQRAEIGRTP